jgi:2-oxoglutarate ferredoxin oxidoreductase subunit alpha
LFRPITLSPFPYKQLAALAYNARKFLVVEQSAGQMLEDVKLAVNGKKPVEFHGRMGGALPEPADILDILRKMSGK